MAIPEFLARWPAWYLLLAGYTIYVGVERWRYAQKQIEYVRLNAPEATHTPGYLAGARFRAFGSALLWCAGGLALLTGSNAVRLVLMLMFLRKAAVDQRDYAVGFAEGRKSAELAAAWEYVRGRIRPGIPDRVAGLFFASVTSVLPALGLFTSILRQ
jgi:hypothetical protein